MFISYQKNFVIILCLLNVIKSYDGKYIKNMLILYHKVYSFQVVDDPCLTNFCNFGELCIRSIDGLSYNCINEGLMSQTNQKTPETFYNYPTNYFLKYHEPNPCLSSPCQEKQICRVLSMQKYVCVNELEMPSDIAHLKSDCK